MINKVTAAAEKPAESQVRVISVMVHAPPRKYPLFAWPIARDL